MALRVAACVVALAGAVAQVPTLEALGSVWLGRNVTAGNMPTVTNFWGSSTVSSDPFDPLGVDTFDAFPFVGWLSTRMTANDANGTAWYFMPNASRWLAHRTERMAAAAGPFADVQAFVVHRFMFESGTTLVALMLRNTGPDPVRLGSLQLLINAGVRTVDGMAWVVPLPENDGSWGCGVLPGGDAAQTPVLRFLDAISTARLVVATAPPPQSFAVGRVAGAGGAWGSGVSAPCLGTAAYGDITLPPGGEWNLTLASVPGTNASAATAELLQVLAGDAGSAAAAASDAAWQARWEAAFTPGNAHYSGNAPVMTASEPGGAAAARFYYAAVLTLVTTERVHWPTSPVSADCPRLYAIGQEGLAGGGAPGGRPLGGSAFWIWDEGYASLTLSLLDPDAVRAYLRALLGGVDWTAANALDLLTGQPILPWPDGFGGGGAYFFNALQLFTMASNYVTATNDTAFLNERLGPQQARVVDTLVALALHWQAYDTDGDLLAEYSDSDQNYLECVPHYRGAVAALQAGNVAMMRSAADLIERLYPHDGPLSRWPPATLRALANNMTAVTLARLYLPGQGFWGAFSSKASPPLAAVPTVVDFAHVGRFLRGNLSAAVRNDSSAFFLDELLFPQWTGWLRALAVPDGPGSQRADHGTTGSYTTWASLSVEALAMNDGDWTRALGLYERFSPVLALGPLGQAGQVQVIGANDTALFPVFKAPEWPYGQICGVSFADVLVRSLYGFVPGWAPQAMTELALSPPLGQGGFVGSLAHLRTPLGRSVTVTSDGSSLHWVFEGAEAVA